jgi:hypothetical protein
VADCTGGCRIWRCRDVPSSAEPPGRAALTSGGPPRVRIRARTTRDAPRSVLGGKPPRRARRAPCTVCCGSPAVRAARDCIPDPCDHIVTGADSRHVQPTRGAVVREAGGGVHGAGEDRIQRALRAPNAPGRLVGWLLLLLLGLRRQCRHIAVPIVVETTAATAYAPDGDGAAARSRSTAGTRRRAP